MEVISPGRLHRAITVAELYKKHESFATNPRIARAMYQVKYIVTIGTGLTDLLKDCKAKGLRKPLLEEISGRFRIVIWRPKSTAHMAGNRPESSQKTPQKGSPINVPINVPINGKVLKAIERSPGINRRRLAQELQVDVRTIGRALSALSGQVEHRGSKKTGGYYLVALKAKEGQS